MSNKEEDFIEDLGKNTDNNVTNQSQPSTSEIPKKNIKTDAVNPFESANVQNPVNTEIPQGNMDFSNYNNVYYNKPGYYKKASSGKDDNS